MALVTISGYPASGKSQRAERLKSYLEQCLSEPSYCGTKFSVVLLSDDTLNIKRSVYDDGRQEKPARAALLSAVQRSIGRDVIVIVDGMNYIKGFRYQMYCVAREHRLRVCTMYVIAQPEQCRAWNAARAEEHDAYNPLTLDNLITRYEEPNSMVRWDSPLFTVSWIDEDIPGEKMWLTITEGYVKPPNAGTSSVAVAPANALHTLENISTAMVSAIMNEQAAQQGMGTGGTIQLPLSSTLKPKVTLPARNVTLSELQRLKRQFVTIHRKAITLGTTEKGLVDWSESSIVDKFVKYLEETLKQ